MDMPSAVVVKLPAALNAGCARKLGRELKSRVAEGSRFVVLDFSHVKSIDLKGIAGLLRCMEQIAKVDGSLQLAGLSPEAAVLLQLTRVDRLMQKFPGFTIEAPGFEITTEPVAEEAPSETSVQPVAA